MLDKQIFENIRKELKTLNIIPDNKLASEKTSDYLFVKGKQSYDINFIIELLKSENISLSSDNCIKLSQALELLVDISQDLNAQKQNEEAELMKQREETRVHLVEQVKKRLHEEGALFDCSNLQCIYISSMILTEPSEFFKFLSKHEMVYTLSTGRVKVYKNTTEDIKEKIADFLKKDFESKSQENLIQVLYSNYFLKAKIKWEDILNYCENMNKAVFIN